MTTVGMAAVGMAAVGMAAVGMATPRRRRMLMTVTSGSWFSNARANGQERT